MTRSEGFAPISTGWKCFVTAPAIPAERVIKLAVPLAGSDRLEVDDLPSARLSGYEDIILPSIRRHDTMREWAGRYARLVLERCQNNKRRACRELGISYA
jgi:hypothetical protein